MASCLKQLEGRIYSGLCGALCAMHVSQFLHNSSAVHGSPKQMQPALTLMPIAAAMTAPI